jgi:hypothetical protein
VAITATQVRELMGHDTLERDEIELFEQARRHDERGGVSMAERTGVDDLVINHGERRGCKTNRSDHRIDQIRESRNLTSGNGPWRDERQSCSSRPLFEPNRDEDSSRNAEHESSEGCEWAAEKAQDDTGNDGDHYSNGKSGSEHGDASSRAQVRSNLVSPNLESEQTRLGRRREHDGCLDDVSTSVAAPAPPIALSSSLCHSSRLPGCPRGD